MPWWVLIALVLLALTVLALKVKQPGRRSEDYPYTKRPILFSPAERSFLGVLDQAVGEEYRIFGKVRVADIVDAQQGLDARGRQTALNRVTNKHFDFVLCRKSDLSVICAIELNDQSHQRRKRQERDAFLAGVCQAVGVPLLQVPAQRGYAIPELRDNIRAAIGEGPYRTSEANAVEPLKVATSAARSPSEAQTQAGQQAQPVSGAPAPPCPKCAAPMVRRQVKGGSNAGKEFWGCSTFPKCRGIVEIPEKPLSTGV